MSITEDKLKKLGLQLAPPKPSVANYLGTGNLSIITL
jgi:hypothetical protein